MVFSYTARLYTIPIVITILTKNGATNQLKKGLQQHMYKLGEQFGVNISIVEVNRFGKIIIQLEFVNFVSTYKMAVLLLKQLYHHTLVDKILISLFIGQNPILEN